MSTAAPIQRLEATTLSFADGDRLECLYVIVDGRSDRHVADFLSHWHARCDVTELDWQAVRRPRSALVGLELTHSCGNTEVEEKRLRLVFDVEADADALARLVETEALVVGTRAYGTFANSIAAYGVDGAAVKRAIQAARQGLADLVAVAS